MLDKEILKMPEEEKNGFIKTLNNMGYMTTSLDPVSQRFVDFCTQGKHALEIGAAYGVATRAVLNNSCHITANDIDDRHLQILKNRCSNEQLKFLDLKSGAFPFELNFKQNSFDAILICRVLHFFSGEEITDSLKIAFDWLKPGGRLFVVAETPYLKNWKRFIPIYEERKQKGEKWPGIITNPEEYEGNRSRFLPEFVHWLDIDVLEKAFKQAGFKVISSEFINRKDFPDDIRYDGRESVGIIGEK